MIDSDVSTKHLGMYTLPTEVKRKFLQGMMGQLTPDENERCRKFFYRNFADDGLETKGVVNQAAYLMERQKGECLAVDGNLSNPDFDAHIMKKLHKEASAA